MTGLPGVPPHDGTYLYCTGRRTHLPVFLGSTDGRLDSPEPQPRPAAEYHCVRCGRHWKLGRAVRRELRAAPEPEIDLSLR